MMAEPVSESTACRFNGLIPDTASRKLSSTVIKCDQYLFLMYIWTKKFSQQFYLYCFLNFGTTPVQFYMCNCSCSLAT